MQFIMVTEWKDEEVSFNPPTQSQQLNWLGYPQVATSRRQRGQVVRVLDLYGGPGFKSSSMTTWICFTEVRCSNPWLHL